MKIKILGTGCPKCAKLYENAKEAATRTGKDFTIEKVTQIQDIIAYGVMMTPALVIDDKVKFTGKVPSVEELEKMFKS